MQDMETHIQSITTFLLGYFMNPLAIGALIATSLALLTGLAGRALELVHSLH